MNFRLIYLLLLLVGTSNIYAQKKRVASKINVEEANASNIIRFGNSVITLSNAAQQTTKNYKSMLDIAEDNLENVALNRQAYAINCKASSLRASDRTEYAAALKTAPAFEQKTAISKLVTQGESDIDNIEKWCQALSVYFQSKQYHTDSKYVAYESIKDSLIVYLKQNGQTWAAAASLASDAGNKAELVLLQKSKIASFVMPMKEDLSALDKTFSLLRNQDISTQELRNQLQKLSQSVTKNKDISTKDVSKLSDYYYREVYTSYYQEMEATIGYLNRLADKLDDTRSDEGDLNAAFGYASSGYNATIEKYNTFVNQ